MYKLVIADTSCLIVLSKIHRIEILRDIFDEISITPEIVVEFGEMLPDWIHIKEVIDKKRQKILELDLDSGEASAIALGLEHETSLLLIDEKKGRFIAKELGLSITGTLGVLIRAKEKSYIVSIREEIDKLKAVDFRMSDKIIAEILQKYE